LESFQEWVVREVPDVLGFMASGWIGWLFYCAALALMILTLLSVWQGKWRRFSAAMVSTFVLGLLGYFAAFSIGAELGLFVLLISFFVIIVGITTLLLAVPVGFLGYIRSRRLAANYGEPSAE
jgi:hypothetical protein